MTATPIETARWCIPLLSNKELDEIKQFIGYQEHCCHNGHKYRFLDKKQKWFGLYIVSRIFCERCGEIREG